MERSNQVHEAGYNQRSFRPGVLGHIAVQGENSLGLYFEKFSQLGTPTEVDDPMLHLTPTERNAYEDRLRAIAEAQSVAPVIGADLSFM